MEVQELIKESIRKKRFQIYYIHQDIQKLKKQFEDLKEKTGIEKWLNHNFVSSSMLTQEFSSFAREYKRELVKQLPENCEIAAWSRGHFYISCFIRNTTNDKFVYLSVSDVRHFPDGWYNDILIRTAKHEKDYTGGSNCQSNWENLKRNIQRLF